MKSLLTKLFAGLAVLLLMCDDVSACTIMLVTKGASADGSVFVSHSNDGFGGDPNIAFVPAKNHKRGSLRPVYPSSAAVDEMPEYNSRPNAAKLTTSPTGRARRQSDTFPKSSTLTLTLTQNIPS